MISRSKYLVPVILCFLLFSCGSKKENLAKDNSIPSDSLISSEKMIHILADLHVVEAAMLMDRNKGLEPKEKPGFYYQGIFAKNHISKSRFDENLKYYRQNPAELVKMYEKVIHELENREKNFSPVK